MTHVMSQPSCTVNFDILNPDKNEGGYSPVQLAEGFDVVFVRSRSETDEILREAAGSGADGDLGTPPLSKRIRLYGDPTLTDCEITEVSTGGSVPVLQANNKSAFGVLLVAGQLVRGGKQNRGINTDIFIEAGKSAQIPVTCVEQGRWSGGDNAGFGFAGFEPVTVRCAKARDVAESARRSRSHAANQQQVWDAVAAVAQDVGVRSSSSDLLQSLREVKARIAAGPVSRPAGARMGAPTGSDEELAHTEELLQRLRAEALTLSRDVHGAIERGGDISSLGGGLAQLRRRLDTLLREVMLLETRRNQILERRRSEGAGEGADQALRVSHEAIARADKLATAANGMLVFFNGEFVAGDLFAERAWFSTLYGELRDSTILSWESVSRRAQREGRAIDPLASQRVMGAARTVVRDTLAGDWSERATPAHGRALLLEHPFLQSSAIAADGDAPLHVLLGTKQPAPFTQGGDTAMRTRLGRPPLR